MTQSDHKHVAGETAVEQLMRVKPVSETQEAIQLQQALARMAELEQLNHSLRLENNQLINLFDSGADPVILVCQSTYRIIRVNAAASALLGYSATELLARPLPDIMAPQSQHELAQVADTLRQSGHVLYESVYVKKDGTAVTVEVNAKTVNLHDVPGFVASVRDITARKKLQASLMEMNNQFDLVLNSMPQIVWMKDLAGVYTYSNASRENFGEEASSGLAGKTDFDIFPVHLARKFRSDDQQVIVNGQTQLIEEIVIIHGRERLMRVRKIPIRNVSGQISAILGIAEDITNLRAAESQIRKLAQAVEQSPECIVITDLDANIEFVNESFLRTTGYRREDLLGKNSRILQSGKTPPQNYRQLWAALTAGRAWFGEFYNRRKDGSEYIEYARIAPIRQDDGTITHYLGIKEDITEKRRNAAILSKSKILLQRVIDAIPDWIFVFDQVNRFMLVNEAYASFLNLKPEYMIGLRVEDIKTVSPDDDAVVKSDLNCEKEISAVFRGELLHYRNEVMVLRNNEQRFIESDWIPLRDAKNQIYGALCYRRDITNRIRVEQEQKELVEQLHQAQKLEMVGQFTGGIAHDFNNVLALILGNAEMLGEAPEIVANEKLARYAGQIVQTGLRARDLVKNLLLFAQKQDMPSQTTDCGQIVTEVVNSLHQIFPPGLLIETHIARDLPPIFIDPVQLHQVLLNLAMNARGALSDKGLVEIWVQQIDVERSTLCDSCQQSFGGPCVMITFRDNGTGIPVEYMRRIFDPFFTTKKHSGGSGLGLSILHGIVHAASGHLTVVSTQGYGTQFRLFFPVGQLSPEPPALPEPVNLSHTSGHIMVVDDENDIVGYLKDLLEGSGYQVSTYTDSRAALRDFENDPDAVDMVLTDQEMAELNGFMLAKAMLALRADLPVAICTGYSGDLDERALQEAGIQSLLIKPVPKKLLLETIQSCLQRNAASQKKLQ